MARFRLHRVRHADTRSGRIRYLLHEPPGFAEEPRPGLLFLHGSEERGTDLHRLTTTAIPQLIERGKNLPFVTISPQCPENVTWGHLMIALQDLLDQIVPQATIDPDRLYLTGISMGGFGAFQLAAEAPQRFAALAPICGGGEFAWAQKLKDIPIWAFHGAKDDVVPASSSQRMVNALKEVGANVRFTLYDDLGHDCWSRAYEDPELYSWMLGMKRSSSRALAAAAPA